MIWKRLLRARLPRAGHGAGVLRQPVVAALVLAAGLLASACSSSPTSPSPPGGTPPPTSSLNIACPASLTVSSPGGAPVAVTFNPPTTTGGVAPVRVSCTHTSGALFPVGDTPVQCTATDGASTMRACTFTVSVTAPMPELSRTRFLAFGDSLTAGEITVPVSGPSRVDASNHTLIVIPSASYPAQLLDLLRARYTRQAAKLEVVNAGVPGEWAEQGAKRLPGVMSNVRPEAVLLLAGGNDLAALGTAGVQRAWVAIDLMAKEIRGHGARAFIATLPPPRPSGTKALPASLVQSLNDRIRTTVRGEGAVLVDLYSALSADVTRYIGVDGLHPTEAGYTRMAEVFFEAIRADLETR